MISKDANERTKIGTERAIERAEEERRSGEKKRKYKNDNQKKGKRVIEKGGLRPGEMNIKKKGEN